MRVGILGPLEISAEDDPIVIGGARLRALMTRLAMEPDRAVSVDVLTTAVWPDGGPDRPMHALQNLVTRLRGALPAGMAVASGHAGYRLEIPADAVDAHRFEEQVRQGREALRDGDTDTARDVLRSALGLWRGLAFSDAREAPDVAAAATRLDEIRLTAVEDSIEADLAVAVRSGDGQGRLAELAAEVEQAAAAHPLRERLHALHVRALHAAGRSAEALAVFERVRQRLAAELGTDPGPELAEAHLAVLQDERPVTRPRGNLQAPADSFIGREPERVAVASRLAASRIVTLTGPGGVGKTRLSGAVAAGIEPPGGTWVVELAPVTHPSDIVPTILATIGVREAGVAPRDPTARLIAALDAGETLLVLDNCDHLVDDVARLVVELVGGCPQLRILATSREPLGTAGESVVVVPPLGLPGADEIGEPGQAVRLFADRAAAMRHDFELTPRNMPTVAEICRRLDGLPLAIELAAAQLRTMSLESLAAGLADRFSVLTRGSRTALPRHRTLNGVVAWSWDLLDEDERAAAERLAVFAGSFATEAAVSVGVPRDMLAGLVDKSLVQLDGDRYRMLETIREYVREYGTDRAAAETAFVDHFVGLAEAAKPQLAGDGQLEWLERLAPDRDNLNEALRVACESGAAEAAVRLGATLSHYWAILGEHTEASRRLLTALRVPGATAVGAHEAAVAGYLFNTVLCGDTIDARNAADTLQIPATPSDPLGGLVAALHAAIRADAAGGLAILDEHSPVTGPWTAAMFAMVRAFLHGLDGDMEAAKDDYLDAARSFEESGDLWGRATSLTHCALTQSVLGDPWEAVATMRAAARVARALGSDVYQRVWVGMLLIDTGEVDEARAELSSVLASGPPVSYAVMARVAQAELVRYDGDLVEARRQLSLAADDLAAGGQVPEMAFRALFHSASGRLAVVAGETAEAGQHLREVVVLGAKGPDTPLVAVGAVGLAMLSWRCGDATTAAELLGVGHTLRGAPDSANPDIAGLAASLRTSLGEAGYETAYGRGRTMGRDAAIAFAEAQARRR